MVVLACVAALLMAAGLAFMRGRGPAAMDDAVLNAAIASGWANAAPDWKARLQQDETQRICTETRNRPSPSVATALMARERARIVYPEDGKLLGDWKKGEALAQSGYGGRFTDKDPKIANGGNCYACHQLAVSEISYGTLGPSLKGYGAAHKFDAVTARAVYDKIYDAQAVQACSQMPRFGVVQFLTIEQIKDVVAYVMSPDSPVNK
jgi:sulfur-oxidizing protein SoxX